jgi:hypothetical protein
MAPMRAIIFFSTAVAPMSEQDLTALGAECAENDRNVGITGMLLHKGGDFLQIIEGSRAVIGDMYARILADPRHTNIRLISDREVPHREFDGEAVGFTNLDKLPPGSPHLGSFYYEAFAAEPDMALLVLAYYFRNRPCASAAPE